MTMLYFLLFLFVFPSIVLAQRPLSSFRNFTLPPSTTGPESTAFDSFGRGPYTGISDGRIVRYDISTKQFVDFAFTAPNRTSVRCNGNNDSALGPICGKPLGLEFYKLRNELYIADAFRGLFVVGLGGGLATLLATQAEGLPFRFLNGLDVDQLTGDVYFSDFSAVFSQSQFQLAVATNDSTGRLLKYERRTRQLTVLQRGLSGANGVALSSDRSYLLVSEFIANRVRRFWLRGPRAFQSEIVATFQGMPDNIKSTSSGDFWVALYIPRSAGTPQTMVPTAFKIQGNGNVLRTLSLDEYYNTTISEVNERGSKLYIGSVEANYVGVLKF